MSAQRKEKVVVGTIVRRPSQEVVQEMARIAVCERARISARAEESAEAARTEKARMTAQAPPTPLYPGRYQDGQNRRPRQPINPTPLPSPEEVQLAAIRRREHKAAEAHIVEEGRRLMERPRTPTPPRRSDDHFDLARWAFRRGY